MRREDGSLRRSAVERPTVPSNGDDLDAGGARRHAGALEKVGHADPRPDLLAPPATGAIDHGGRLTARELRKVREGKLGGSAHRASYAQAPCCDIDRRHGVETPDGHRERVACEGSRMTGPGDAPRERDAIEREAKKEWRRQEPHAA